MKFDPFAWQEVPTNEEIPFGKGRLRLRLSGRAPLYVSAQGVQALVGIEEAFEVDLSEEVTFRVEAPKALRAFMFVPEPTAFEPVGEVFTNADRMVSESGTMAEVTRAMRLFELERRNALKEIRVETAKLKRAQAERTSDGDEQITLDENNREASEPHVADPLPVDQPKAEPAKAEAATKGGAK